MPQHLDVFEDVGLDEGLLKLAVREHESATLPRLRKLWAYYRNGPEVSGGATTRRTRLAQEAGLPARLTSATTAEDDRARRREIVIENDIAWRLHA